MEDMVKTKAKRVFPNVTTNFQIQPRQTQLAKFPRWRVGLTSDNCYFAAIFHNV